MMTKTRTKRNHVIIKKPQVVVIPMSPLMRVILLQPFIDLIKTRMLVKSSVTTRMMLLCHSWFHVQEKLKYRPHFNGQQTKIKFEYLVEIYRVSFPALHSCHHIPSEANYHLALIEARSSQYKNYKENGARNSDEVYYEIYVTSLKSDC